MLMQLIPRGCHKGAKVYFCAATGTEFSRNYWEAIDRLSVVCINVSSSDYSDCIVTLRFFMHSIVLYNAHLSHICFNELVFITYM